MARERVLGYSVLLSFLALVAFLGRGDRKHTQAPVPAVTTGGGSVDFPIGVDGESQETILGDGTGQADPPPTPSPFQASRELQRYLAPRRPSVALSEDFPLPGYESFSGVFSQQQLGESLSGEEWRVAALWEIPRVRRLFEEFLEFEITINRALKLDPGLNVTDLRWVQRLSANAIWEYDPVLSEIHRERFKEWYP